MVPQLCVQPGHSMHGTIAKIDASRPRRDTLWRRFGRSQRGATAIEFAFVGPIFLAIVAATIETALTFFAAYTLDTAVIDSSRSIRTGQEEFRTSPDVYRAAMCDRLYGIFDCQSVRISVSVVNNFPGFTPRTPVDAETGEWTIVEAFPGQDSPAIGSDSVVLVEAYYKWPTIFNIPGLHTGLTGDGKRLLAAAHMFKTEPEE